MLLHLYATGFSLVRLSIFKKIQNVKAGRLVFYAFLFISAMER